MTARSFDGAAVQRRLLEDARTAVRDESLSPEVALIMVENDDAMTAVNFFLHHRVFTEVGLTVRPLQLPADTSQEALETLIRHLNADDDVDAVLVLVPLPPHLDVRRVLSAISPDKEVEGLHPVHVGALLAVSTHPPLRRPVVPAAVLEVAAVAGRDLTACEVVVVTDVELMRTNAVANVVARVGALAVLPPETPVTVVPATSPAAPEYARRADVLVVSLQTPRTVTDRWVKPGALVVDFNPVIEGWRPHPDDPARLIPVMAGGVDVESVREVAGDVSAIPGGVGPVMLGVLVGNVVDAARRHAVDRREGEREVALVGPQ